MPRLVERTNSGNRNSILDRPDLDRLACQLVQRTYEVVIQHFGKLDPLETKFIYETYIYVKEILGNFDMIGSLSKEEEATLVSKLVIGLYILIIVWVQNQETTPELIQQLKEVVRGVLADSSSWQENRSSLSSMKVENGSGYC